jgi:formate dehydrogenase major subunit
MALWDLENADCIVVMGSNMAENHPVGFRFVVEAQRRGATVIHVDPRFTRTSALADIHAPIRSGSDIAFLGGIIHHILENDLWFRDFVLAYTNIANIIEEGYEDPEQTGGVFSGFNADTGSYKQDTWQYKGKIVPSSISEHRVQTQEKSEGGDFEAMTEGPPPTDATLQHPHCVYQIMRRHYARYTPEMVERVTGCSRDTFLAVANALTRNSGREKTGAFCYAVGWTHHTVGVQIIRAAAIIQGLLGNIGRPGGGILALRGHASIQGSTDIPTLYNMLPSYLPQPNVFHQHGTLQNYLDSETPTTGWWANMPKYVVSLLNAWYGEHARSDNEWGYQFVPKLTGDVSQLPMTLSMLDGVMKGQFILGQNPVVGAVNSDLVERGLAKLDWLVVRDFAMTETANFWQNGRLVQRGELRPEEIGTEVFFLPSSLAGEKDGTVTNTSRLVQWHDAVLEPLGDSRSDLWFIYHLGKRLKQLYADSTEPRDAAIQALTWTYPERGKRAEPEAEAVLREINGYTVADRKQIPSYLQLKDDGSTACGGWMYCGVHPADGRNVARSRIPDEPGGPGSHAGWAFSWPSNRRTLYNRASADLDGRPWSERKKMVWWDESAGKWTGNDVPDFVATKRPDYRPDWTTHPHGMDALGGDDPFIMEADGKCQLFVPSGLKDGPLPTHYEPVESPVRNAMYDQRFNPAAKLWTRPGNELHAPDDSRFPYVFTTYRLTELHCGGVISRVTPHTAELQPEAFVEISPELARELGICHLGWTVLSTLRGEIEARAMLTERMRPFRIGDRTVHQVGMPWVFGWEGFARGDIANVLLAITGDANTSIHTTKAVTCALRPGRLQNPVGATHAS